ncbi:MAG TPA: hypothetical protein VGV37_18490 [Aliidongia sp.]|uniref:hypothetical protein n=1 Tax=Aliidongia sp. TaxID=1914230 RepID=UPI002DDCE052|nr:hypothetical protein [Aliidongia sp.]HEV2676521.1 hypothetical protein [Aliidongia sp.]
MSNTVVLNFDGFSVEVSPYTAAQIAMHDARFALGRRSANKVRLDTVTVRGQSGSLDKVKKETFERMRDNALAFRERILDVDGSRPFRTKLTSGAATLTEIRSYADLVCSVGTGNCFEYAIVAFIKLYAQGWRRMELVQLDAPSTHCFVVLGSARRQGMMYEAGFAYAPGSVICDPWAHIACAADVYATVWRDKMLKWQGSGKQISTPDGLLDSTNYTLQHRQLVMYSLPGGH